MLNITKNRVNESKEEKDERYRNYTIHFVRALAVIMVLGYAVSVGDMTAVVAYKSISSNL